MTVLARSKTGAGRIRRHREGRLGRVTGRDAPSTNPGATVTTQTAVSAHRRREAGGASEDKAIYMCQCGFVFQALVSTSVDCPHCGGSQAW
jgi:hypothetical protein